MMHVLNILIVAIFVGASLAVSNKNVDLHCTDFQGRPVQQSEEFVPRMDDPCMTCTCEDGFPVMCTSVLCSPPDCKFWEAIEGECCRFHCIETPIEADDGHNATGGVNTKPNAADTTNLGLRLVASTVTSLLILALLLFMIHRLRQRRTLISMRRLNAENQEEEAVAYMTQIDQVDIGIEFPPYEDPPPPYSPPKPPHIPQGEAPPPYEENINGENEANNNEGPNPDTVGTGQNSIRPSQGQFNPSAGEEQPRNGTINRQNQRNSELSHDNGSSATRDGGQANAPAGSNEQRPGNSNSIMARGRVIETLLRSASSSRTSSLSRAQGNKKDKKCAGKRGQNYGLSIALAALGGDAAGSSEASPSRVMVSMQNNNPHCSLVRFDEEPSRCNTASNDPTPQSVVANMVDVDNAPASSSFHEYHNSLPDRNKPRSGPDSWTQFIKKSDSIEIKRGSNSPRNSFLLEDKHFQPDYHSTCLREGQRASDNSANSAGHSSDSSLSLLGAAAPRNTATSHSAMEPPKKAQDGCGVGADLSRSASYVEPGRSDPLTESRISLPPMILDLPIREASRNSVVKPDSFKVELVKDKSGHLVNGQNNPLWNQSGAAVSKAFSTMPSSGDDALHTPTTSSPSPQSPTPVGNSTARSGSQASNISIFSVCSETGERKNPAATPPYTLRNDVQYPLAPFSSLYTAPVTSPLDSSAERNLDRLDFSNRADLNCGASGTEFGKKDYKTGNSPSTSKGPSGKSQEPKSSKYSPSTVANEGKSQPTGPTRGNGRKVIYIDAEELCEKSSSQDSVEQVDNCQTGSKDGSKNGKAKKESQKKKSKKKVAQASCSTQAGVSATNTQERNSLTKVKDKKSVSSSSPDRPAESPNRREEGCSEQQSRASPERSHSFKQYGFIDNPEVLNLCHEQHVYPSTGDQVPDSTLAEKVRQRSTSRERRRSRENSNERTSSRRRPSGERGKKSRETSKSRSRSRERSKSRGKKSPGEERHRKRRSRPSGSAADVDIPSDVAIVNGDLNSVTNRNSHESRSPSRRHKKNSRGTAPTVDNADPRLDDQKNANTATNGEVYNGEFERNHHLLNAGPLSNYISMTEGNTQNGSSHNNTRHNLVSNTYVGCNNVHVDRSEPVNPIQANHSIIIDR